MIAHSGDSAKSASAPPEVTLLVVDDDAMLVQVVSTMMTYRGYQVLCAPTVEDAGVILEREAVDIILSDLMIDGSDRGLGFLTETMAQGRCEAAVLMSGHPRRAELEPQLGPTLQFIQKPFRAPELDNVLRSALDAANE